MKHLVNTSRTIAVVFMALSAASTGVAANKKSQEESKPNILFIFADDQMWNSLGSIEGCPVKTPNLDRLREQGVSFTHAYNQGSYAAAVCVASRMMLNTGSQLWRAASFSPNVNRRDRNSPKYTLPYTIERRTPEALWSEYMKEAGYETYFTGKWHVHGFKNPPFDHVKHVRAGMPSQSKARYTRTFTPGEPDTIWSPYDESFGGYWKGGKHWSEVLGDDSVAFLNQARESDNPFFMYLAFNAPHDPRQAPKEFVDMYPAEDIEVPENFLPEYPYNEYAGSGRTLRDEMLAPFPRTEYSVQVNRQEYYALISHMDVQIGRILDALEATGKADNTYIFFTADHGLAVGDHGFIGKQNMYDSSMRVPFLMAGPGVKPDSTVNAPIYLQDVMATSLDIAGLKKPKQVDFNSLLPLATGQTTQSVYGDIYGAYFGSQRMIRTDRYKMIIYPVANKVRLYDMINDPMEMNDLAEGEERPVELLNALFARFKKLQKEMDDPIDVTEAFNNFLNNVPPPPLEEPQVRAKAETPAYRSIPAPKGAAIDVETASAASGFSKLPVPAASGRTVTANQKTNNDPVASLTDGRLAEGMGPVFPNGVQNGAYKMDLGSVQSVAAITSWSYKQGSRGRQKITLYGSDSVTDPGWDLSRFTELCTIDTAGSASADYTAASLRADAGKSLGKFRWIIWAASPVTGKGGGENTAFQELAVEIIN
ncbi:sulfatase-like hydrolase/transferase [Pontiellaceae bacterium B12219]|nr:sulfatase-like hydrolase/transferase [Pontiellaceae bacterium B12219]